ncbi:exopolysaccharide biosynthesis polyprenyl glycosylphosphotransferase [Polaribacter sp. AHE13PA]|uniref:exopolysaccharide biosynthesis polyprenyl glycosylphosphotransferase n=1 Tax=Polaribacter sp. AHE13PA TaxID=2745562 RepID=UPI001C4F2049|nr:exopolysaccharide biosynthesis polyprenyl glycosylphosphotransferase [Polaribacter sp. AHE13PA]QXP67505.1 exopolysaccharide biosynthesis polyprenyl glycosylphosphotransferase [Polaribacter sp. AHE13PA]
MATKISYFNVSERKLFLRIIDVIILISSLYLASLFINFTYIKFNSNAIFNWLLLLIFYFSIFGQIFQLYGLNVSNNRYLTVRAAVLTVFATTIFYIFTPYYSPELPPNRLQIGYFFLLSFIPILLWRFIYISLIFSPKYFKSIVFVGNSERIKKLLTQVYNDSYHDVSAYLSDQEIKGINGFIDISKTTISSILADNFITEVVVSKRDLSDEVVNRLNKELILLFEKGVNIVSYETFYEDVNVRIPREYLDHNFYRHINFSKNNSNNFYLFGLRIIDILLSLIGAIGFLCVIPLIFVGNIIANRGPLFYTQLRVGKNGKPFRIFKLRSMVRDAEKGGAVWAKKNDIRITAFGKFLRRTRLDEMPQFFNIIKGDMSLIGPRPERPEFVKDLEDKIPFYAIRHVVRPGLTGWAQVNYPYANTVEEQETKLRYDLYYIKERSTFLDFKIFIKTFTTVLYFKGQ